MNTLYRHSDIISRNRFKESTHKRNKKKTEAIEYLESNSAVLGNYVYYCSNAKDNRLFAVDVHREVADKETYTLVANEVTNKVLIVMNIPKGTMNGTNVRDVHDKYTLRFKASDYCKYKTSFSLHEYIVQKVKY